MKHGRVSRTALKIGLLVLTLNEKQGWSERLPEGMAAMTERLLLAAQIPMVGPRRLRLNKSSGVLQMFERAERDGRGPSTAIGERKLFMNRHVLEAIEAGATQVLVLGAGFDTLCLRLAPRFPKLRWFEIDHPATGAAKARGVAREGQPANMRLIQADLGARPLDEVLAAEPRWDSGATSVILAEGLLMYLSPLDVRQLFTRCDAVTGPRSRLAFSHLLDLDSVGPLVRASLRVMGEPWLSSMTRAEVPDFAAELGWRLLDQHPEGAAASIEGFAAVEKG